MPNERERIVELLHAKHDASCYVSVCHEHYDALVAERDALREALEALYVEVETSESIGICLPDLSCAEGWRAAC